MDQHCVLDYRWLGSVRDLYIVMERAAVVGQAKQYDLNTCQLNCSDRNLRHLDLQTANL